MRLYSTALLMASVAMTMTACIQTPSAPNTGSSGGLSGGNNNNNNSSGGKLDNPPPTPEGEAEFVAKVYPELSKNCGTCHATGSLGAPKFLAGAAPRDAYYNVHYYRDGALIQPPSTNLFLNKGKHEGPDALGPVRTVLTNWLLIENKDFDDGTKPQNFFDTLSNFGSCMNFDQFQLNQLDQIFKLPVRAGNATCQTCHDNDHVAQSGNLLLNNNARAVFDGLTAPPSEFKLVSAIASASGSFQELVPSFRLIDKGSEFNNCSAQVAIDLNFNVLDPKYCHPDYTFPNALQDRLEKFVDATLAASKTGLCKNE